MSTLRQGSMPACCPYTMRPLLSSAVMTIIINETLRAYIDPLTEDEAAALERSLLAEGCRDALVLWGEILVDGHNRYRICQKHGIAFQTVQNTSFKTMDDVYLWMIDNHLGRRSVSDFQRGILALRKKEIVAMRRARKTQAALAADEEGGNASDASVPDAAAMAAPPDDPGPPWSREEVARAARVSSSTLGQIEKIQKTATPELVDAVKSGVISINAAAAVASLPQQAQVQAVAGGKKELREAARQVRQTRQPARVPPDAQPLPEDATDDQREIHRLTQALAAMTEECEQLRKKVQHLTIALAQARGSD